MNAALLCPGPSLVESFTGCAVRHELIIGVNRAAVRFACHWWAAMDYPLIRDERRNVLGGPSLYTRRQTWLDIERRVAPFHCVLHEDTLSCPVPRWREKTATCALILAESLGATHVDVFGADWAGRNDFDGVSRNGDDRTDKRWQEESRVWADVTDYLAGRGVEICRHTPTEKPATR